MMRGEPREGYILVAVLGVMLLLTGFMAAGSMFVRSALDTSKVGDADVATAGLARGGLELAAYQLFVIKASSDAIDGRRANFGGGTVATHIVDESGKADLNGSDPKLLASIFQSAGLDSRSARELVARIVDMRGADRAQPGEAAPGAPPAVPPSQGTKAHLRGFQSVDQLGDVLDLARADLRAVTPLVTVYNPDGKIDILTASPVILSAIPDMSAAAVELILARRKGAGREEIDRLVSALDKAGPFVKTERGPAFTVRIDATSAKGSKKTLTAVVAASTSSNEPYYVLDWWE